MKDAISQLFSLLDRWRHLPDYQLERRADVFFALYVREVIEAETGVALADAIIPELPLALRLLRPEVEKRLSAKVDYALFAADLRRVYFVELKTDQGSKNATQDENLQRACELGFRKLVEGIVDIAEHTDEKGKYYHLLHALAQLGFVELPDELATFAFAERRQGVNKRLRAITVAERDPPIDVLYVLPRAEGVPNAIGFDRFADCVRRHDD